MMTTWNVRLLSKLTLLDQLIVTRQQFCFTGGLVEASVTLPGANDVVGLWPVREAHCLHLYIHLTV